MSLTTLTLCWIERSTYHQSKNKSIYLSIKSIYQRIFFPSFPKNDPIMIIWWWCYLKIAMIVVLRCLSWPCQFPKLVKWDCCLMLSCIFRYEGKEKQPDWNYCKLGTNIPSCCWHHCPLSWFRRFKYPPLYIHKSSMLQNGRPTSWNIFL